MKRTYILILSLLCAFSIQAQTFREDGYSYYYDADHRVVVRSCVECEENYQDLWNGDYVRLINDYVYIYRGNSRVTYGTRVWLEHTGHYTISINGTMYLVDSDGYRTGLYGDIIDILWNGVARVNRGDYWYLYTTDNRRLGSVYSDEKITLYHNGYYCIHMGDYYYVAAPSGYRIGSTYSTEEPDLMNNGQWRCYRGGRTYLVDE